MKKILISLLAIFFIYGCSSDGASYYQLNSYNSIVKEIDKTISNHVWVPADLGRIDIIDDPYDGRHKMITDSYFSKDKEIRNNLYQIRNYGNVFSDDVLIGHITTLGQLDCYDNKNSYPKLVLINFFIKGKESFAQKISISIQNGLFLVKKKEYTPNEEMDEVSIHRRRNIELVPDISSEMNQVFKKVKNLICSNPIK